MRNGILFLVAVMVAVVVMMSPPPVEAGGGFGFGVQSFGHQQVIVQQVGVPINSQFFSNRGVFVAAPHPQAVFVQAVPRFHGVQIQSVQRFRPVQVQNFNRGFSTQRVRSVQRFRGRR